MISARTEKFCCVLSWLKSSFGLHLLLNPGDDDFVVNDDMHDWIETVCVSGDSVALLEAPVILTVPLLQDTCHSCTQPI